MLAEDTIDPDLLEQLPTLPGTAMAFIGMCDDLTIGVRDVAALAQSDPALVAKILHVANSPYYSPREPVVDLARAAAILGLRNLKVIGVGFAILGDLWRQNDRSDGLIAYIGASTTAGSGARSFSARVGTGRDEAALTAGLLSFVGELSLLRCFPDRVSALWARCEGPPSPEVFRDEFGIDGAALGMRLVERWSIPADLRVGVRLRTRTFEERLARRPEVFDAAVGFGTAIAELLLDPKHSLVGLKPYVGQWGISDDDLGEYLTEFRSVVHRTAQQIEPRVADDLDLLVVEARDDYLTSASEVRAASEMAEVQRRIDELEAENGRLAGLSLQDPLTEIPNRAAFDNELRKAAATALRSEGPPAVAVALFDLDRFKAVNDTEGHQAGDDLLVAVARAGATATRNGELFARLGGDEFAMVLHPGSITELSRATERIRSAMNIAAVEGSTGQLVTVSAGAAMLTNVAGDLDDSIRWVVRDADEALYAVKRSGRNRSEVSPRRAGSS